MQTIRVANGYATDLGAMVERWRVNWDDEELPALSVCDLTQEVSETDIFDDAYTVYKLPVQLRAFVAEENRAAEIDLMTADIFKAIASDRQWTVSGAPLAIRTEYERDGFILPDDAFLIAAGAIQINVFYYTQTFNAYE